MLESLQANLLKSHGRKHTLHVYLDFGVNIEKAYQESIRAWLAYLGQSVLTSYHHQVADSIRYKQDNSFQSAVYTLALSRRAYFFLGIPESLYPGDSFFTISMTNEMVKRQLNDYHLTYTNGIMDRLYAILTIAHDQVEALTIAWQQITSSDHFQRISSFCKYEIDYGYKNTDEKGNATGPLGFVDGLTNPRDFLSVANAVLVKEPEAGDNYGSYMVFRKMYTNRKYFDEYCKAVAEKYNIKKAYVSALLMGRFPKGAPLMISAQNISNSDWTVQGKEPFFDYSKDRDGNICPFAAHIRSINPRADLDKLPIVRRSMNYTDSSGESGLLFISYQKSIEDQFMPSFKEGKTDHILYNPQKNISFPRQRGSVERGIEIERKETFTEFRGGDFFFCPSLKFLRELEQVAYAPLP